MFVRQNEPALGKPVPVTVRVLPLYAVDGLTEPNEAASTRPSMAVWTENKSTARGKGIFKGARGLVLFSFRSAHCNFRTVH
jgi:hypothetical protein